MPTIDSHYSLTCTIAFPFFSNINLFLSPITF